ncbi:MAG: hypothetical protein QOF33_279 [Thermomicrobiales bacterium]|jgi:hypothetical protein|nr:hypothetical protein [Thermomicrobiales bacterium]
MVETVRTRPGFVSLETSAMTDATDRRTGVLVALLLPLMIAR